MKKAAGIGRFRRLSSVCGRGLLSLLLAACLLLSGCGGLFSSKTVILDPSAPQDTSTPPEDLKLRVRKISAIETADMLDGAVEIDCAWDEQEPEKLLILAENDARSITVIRVDCETGFYETLYTFSSDGLFFAALAPGGRYLVYGYFPTEEAKGRFVSCDLVTLEQDTFYPQGLDIAWTEYGGNGISSAQSSAGLMFCWSRNGERLAVWSAFPGSETVVLYKPGSRALQAAFIPRLSHVWDVGSNSDSLIFSSYGESDDYGSPRVRLGQWRDGCFLEAALLLPSSAFWLMFDPQDNLLFNLYHTLYWVDKAVYPDETFADPLLEEDAGVVDIPAMNELGSYLPFTKSVDTIAWEGKQYIAYTAYTAYAEDYESWEWEKMDRNVYMAQLENGVLVNRHLIYKAGMDSSRLMLSPDASRVLVQTDDGQKIVLDLE